MFGSAVRQLAGAVEVTEVAALAGLDGFAGEGAAYLAGGHEGTPRKRVLLLVRPAVASGPWSYPSRLLVLSADAVE